MATEFNWRTDDGLDIYAKDWSVDSPKAVFVLVHGMGEHINRYNHVAEFVNGNQIAMIGNDHRGHGKSGGKRGHFRKYEDYLDEVDTLIAETKKRYPDVPMVLYGHSKGGNIVLNYLVRKRPQVDAAMVTGPWIELAFKPSPVLVFLGKMMRNIAPGFTQPSGLDVTAVSSNPAITNAYVADDLVHDKVSAEAGMGMMDAGQYLIDYQGDTPCPLLIMHGEADKVTSQPASEAFANKLKGDVTYKKFPGLYHEIHNEVEQQEVFDYFYDWLKTKLTVVS
jgi:alpha-beta hydrolase superfamily lysophospholipase